MPTALRDTAEPFRNQIATVPLSFAPENVALAVAVEVARWAIPVVGTVPRAPVCGTCRPFSSQIATVPVVSSRQRMSALPSPLKSPVPAMIQFGGTVPRGRTA